VLDARQDSMGAILHIAGPPRRYSVVLPLAHPPRGVQLNGHVLPPGRNGSAQNWRYDMHTGTLSLKLLPAQQATVVSVAR
jgi:hypothetical protein